jgi:hypothetical protein
LSLLFKRNSSFNASSPLLFKVTLPTAVRQYIAYSEKKGKYAFSPKRGVKWCLFGDNAVFAKIRLCTRI